MIYVFVHCSQKINTTDVWPAQMVNMPTGQKLHQGIVPDTQECLFVLWVASQSYIACLWQLGYHSCSLLKLGNSHIGDRVIYQGTSRIKFICAGIHSTAGQYWSEVIAWSNTVMWPRGKYSYSLISSGFSICHDIAEVTHHDATTNDLGCQKDMDFCNRHCHMYISYSASISCTKNHKKEIIFIITIFEN